MMMTFIMSATAATTAATATAHRPASVVVVELLDPILVNPPPPLVSVLLVLVLIFLFLLFLFLIFVFLIFILVVPKDMPSVADNDLSTLVGEVIPDQGGGIEGMIQKLDGRMQSYGQRGDQYR